MTFGSIPAVIVLMGVAGAGKTTVGRRLAAAAGAAFVDADDFHAPASVAKMRRGEPLTDADRAPWLDALCARAAESLARDEPLVLACSALRRAYRDALVPANAADRVRFVYLRVGRDALARRLGARVGHYAGAALLDSQLATLEEPDADERVLVVDGERPVDDVVRTIATALDGS